MKITGFFLSALLAFTLLASTAMAGRKGDDMMKNPCDMKGSMMGSMMNEGHKLNQEMMEMLKETMTILRDIKHYPDEAQKKRLDEMIGRIDGMVKEHKSMMEKKKEWKDKKSEKMKEMREEKMEKKQEMMGN